MKSLIFGAIGAMTLGLSANAAVLDFAAEAAGNERGVVDGTVIVFDGLGVTFSADGPNASDDNVAYFDDVSGGKPAGLGVCKVLAGDQCTPSSDDNITTGESVTLSFSETVDLSQLRFRNANHDDISPSMSTLLYAINGGALSQNTFAFLSSSIFTGVDSITLAFGGNQPNQFYVNVLSANPVAAVPLPAAAPLLLSGLGLLGFQSLRRRKQRA